MQGFDLHLARLRRDHLAIFATPLSDALLAAALVPVTDDPAAVDATLRIAIAPIAAGMTPRIHVSLLPPRPVPAVPVRLTAVVHRRSHPMRKHDDIGAQQQLQAQARCAGFDDVLMLDDAGRVLEGTFWNLVACREGQLLWPEGPSLHGVAQQLLQRALSEAGIAQRSLPLPAEALSAADAVFAMNARGVWAVASIDDRRFRLDDHGLYRLRQLLAAQPWCRLADAAATLAKPSRCGKQAAAG